ncbi:MAG: PTS sugar transporter subunit IIA [Pseudomonadales bacterium]
MKIASILSPQRTLCRLAANSKKRAIELAAEFIAERDDRIDEQELYRLLIAREKVSPTGLGSGIAIPHCRMANCTGIMGSLVTLEQAVDFEAMDDEPVSTLFILIVPEKEMEAHIEVLSMLVERFQHSWFREKLEAASNPDDLYLAAISEKP